MRVLSLGLSYCLLSVRNPFLLAIYNPVLAVLAFDGSGLHP